MPEEDERKISGDVVGRLRKALYGTQDAPVLWQRLVRRIMLDHGFEASRTTACVYYNRKTGVKAVAHVDDFLLTGGREPLEQLRKELQEGFEVDGDIVGPADDEVRSASFLGRSVRWTDAGLEIEGDQKVIRSLLEENEMQDCAGVEIPGVKAEPTEGEASEMLPRLAT